MYSNSLIRSLCPSSDERNLRLAPDDWQRVLEANKDFHEDESEWRGNSTWGRYMLAKLGPDGKNLSLRRSLELCCGNGFLYFSFRDLLDAPDEGAYIDLSRSQCEAFRERCTKQGMEPPKILCGDIGHLDFVDGSLDLVYGHSFLHHLPDVGAYLREANRVLAPGGRFIALHEPTATSLFCESFPRSLWKRNSADSLTDIWLINPEVITRLLEESGFRRVSIYPNRLLASLLVIPWDKVLCRIIGLRAIRNGLVRSMMLADSVERLLPYSVRLSRCPSIAIVAEK